MGFKIGDTENFPFAESRRGLESGEGVSGFALPVGLFFEVGKVVIVRGPLVLHNININ